MYVATIAALALIWLYFWSRYRDPFHPLIVLLPQFAFLYGYMPLELYASDSERFLEFAGREAVYRYQLVVCILIGCVICGVVATTHHVSRSRARWRMIMLAGERNVRAIALVFGLVGLSCWLYMIQSAGGFAAAYGQAYGGGWASSGYVRELRYIGLVGALLVFVPRVGRGMRALDWGLVLLCVAPTLIHGAFGARRGPAFVALVVLFGGYIYFMRKRVSMTATVGAGIAVGVAMLFLVANRSMLYVGTDAADLRDPMEHLLRWESNEYLIGARVLEYTEMHGAFYGAREAVWLAGRLIPRFLWPTVYRDLPAMLGLDVDVTVNGGVDQEAITVLSSWTPSIGSAEGFAASLCLELGWLAPLGAFAIGAFYGATWRQARISIAPRVLYPLAVAFSVYLVMQSFDPWLYRLILFGLPTYLIVLTLQNPSGRRVRRRAPVRLPRRLREGLVR